MRFIPPKRWLPPDNTAAIAQKTEQFLTTVERTSNPTETLWVVKADANSHFGKLGPEIDHTKNWRMNVWIGFNWMRIQFSFGLF
jgi:hypothetical protein